MSRSTAFEFDMAIIGGGYSGMTAAICATLQGLQVCILEKNAMLGKKILSTGNGRCNFTNKDLDSKKYNCSCADFIQTELIDYKDSLKFFETLGVGYKDDDGYYYPYTNQAQTVRDAFEFKINDLGIPVFLNSQVKRIDKDDSFIIKTINKDEIKAKTILFATGGLSAPKTGSNGDGFYLAGQLGFSVIEPVPALVGLYSNSNMLKALAGTRFFGKCSFMDIKYDGEIQFNKDGISGYPIMCLSGHVARYMTNNSSASIVIDLLPFLSQEELYIELDNRFKKQFANRTLENALNGLLPKAVISAVLSELDFNVDCISKELLQDDIEKMAAFIKNLSFEITGTKGFDASQVTSGGIDCSQINPRTMSAFDSKKAGIFFAGEILDVDGICGGYNLEWARYSAKVAVDGVIEYLNDKN